MSKTNSELWLFDYSRGVAYEAFSKCEDATKQIEKYLANNYNFNGKTVLEIGAGSGKFTSFLARSCSELLVVEKSDSLMQINRKKNHDTNNNISFILTDVYDLKIDSCSVDAVFAGWSLTSMRSSLGVLLKMFGRVLREDGRILLVENAGNDEFCKIAGIEDFTSEMRKIYEGLGFMTKKVVNTIIKLPNEKVFHDAFPDKKNVTLYSLEIQHRILILELQASILKGSVRK